MTDLTLVHSTFTIEREYAASPARVFAAWADSAKKARWFAGEGAARHELDFRVGGRETTEGRDSDGNRLTFTSQYHDIVTDQRIVYSSTLSAVDAPVTVSLTTVQLDVRGEGTTLLLTEHGVFLDGHELPEWREQGTRSQLSALEVELATTTNEP